MSKQSLYMDRKNYNSYIIENINQAKMSEMFRDILLQVFLISASLFVFLFMYNVPQNLFSKFKRSRSVADFQSKRHFVKGAQLLAQARSKNDSKLAQSAQLEAEKAILLDPKDAAAYLLKALALELQGLKSKAIEEFDLALTRDLEVEERANALVKRAELRLEVSPVRVEWAVEDLVESVGLKGDGVKAFWLLGQCYEKMGSGEKAKKAYEDALQVQPGFASAQKALDNLVSSS